jgi:predicted dehydrogenase
MNVEPTLTNRRAFLQKSTALTVGAAIASTLTFPRTVHAGVSEKLRIGLIGCGGRGTGAAQNALLASRDNVLTAVGDAFVEPASSCVGRLRRSKKVADQVHVPDDHVFTGFDAYKKVIDSGVDVVLLAEPPHFRPEHFEYAVAAGKHVFLEKPVAVDARGVQRVSASSQLAQQKGLSVVSGLCWRYHPAVQETVRRIVEDGAIGEIISIESCYNSGTLWHRGDKPTWSRMEYTIRNWTYFTWLSGDIINEQAIHSLDKSAWVLGDSHPESAFGMGGRQQRTGAEFGDVYDHFAVFYQFPSGVRVNFMCRQQDNCSNYIDDVVRGTKGEAHILANEIKGEHPWKFESKDSDKIDMYDLEHVAMFDAIRNGKPINNGHYMCNSTLMAIMGRMAAYTGKTLTWDECRGSELRLGPAEYAWNDEVPACKPAIPG